MELTQKAPEKACILENHIDTDRTYWFHLVDIQTAKVLHSMQMGSVEEFAYEMAVWRLDEKDIMLITNNFANGQQNITIANLVIPEAEAKRCPTGNRGANNRPNSRGLVANSRIGQKEGEALRDSEHLQLGLHRNSPPHSSRSLFSDH